MIRHTGLDELQMIYEERIKTDFPPMERRPLSTIRKLYRQGRYVCLVLCEGEKLLAYATFLCDTAVDSVFLDYYAVDPAGRGKGIGSRFLSLLCEHWANKSGMILECESPRTAKHQEERALRERRIEFYRRGGAVLTPLLWRAFGVEYRILCIPTIGDHRPVNVAGDLQALYALSLPAVTRKLFTRLSHGG